jgi:hypothetical protein
MLTTSRHAQMDAKSDGSAPSHLCSEPGSPRPTRPPAGAEPATSNGSDAIELELKGKSGFVGPARLCLRTSAWQSSLPLRGSEGWLASRSSVLRRMSPPSPCRLRRGSLRFRCAAAKAGAGGGNRTPETSLENWSFTTKLRPRGAGRQLRRDNETVKLAAA